MMGKWSDQGYWKSKLFYWQSLVYYFFYSAIYRSITWFSPANQGIPFGGMLDEKKDEIYDLIPKRFLPKTICVTNTDDILERFNQAKLEMPVFLKPNVGLKGLKVSRIDSLEKLSSQDFSTAAQWIIQEEITEKVEYAILYHRDLTLGIHGVSSASYKIYPTVKGDGTRSVRQLINDYSDPYVHKDSMLLKHQDRLDTILASNTEMILHRIGNYSRGSKFYQCMDIVTPELVEGINTMMADIDGIDFCRIDLKADSIEDLHKGNFKVMEINGAKSEPLHIYDPSISFLKAITETHKHWRLLRSIVQNKYSQGATFPSAAEGLKALAGVKSVMRD